MQLKLRKQVNTNPEKKTRFFLLLITAKKTEHRFSLLLNLLTSVMDLVAHKVQ